MTSPLAIAAPVDQKSARLRKSNPARYFYVAAAGIMLGIMLAGFSPFYLRGEGLRGRKISPDLLPLVVLHGSAMTAWVVLFLSQALLIPARKLRVHMKLGWLAVAIAVVTSASGFAVAVESVRPASAIPFWGMAYRQFMMIMFAEMGLFTLFVLAGVVSRKKPRVHRTMMLLATLSILAGATVRMPILFPMFGEEGWMGIFGPIFTLGALLLIGRSLLGRALDRPFVVGYAALVVVYVATCRFAVSSAWSHVARAFFNT